MTPSGLLARATTNGRRFYSLCWARVCEPLGVSQWLPAHLRSRLALQILHCSTVLECLPVSMLTGRASELTAVTDTDFFVQNMPRAQFNESGVSMDCTPAGELTDCFACSSTVM